MLAETIYTSQRHSIMQISTASHATKGGAESLEAFSVDDSRARFIVLFLGYPHLQ
jgi:hypothetical protein